jgi:hypothetical protein
MSRSGAATRVEVEAITVLRQSWLPEDAVARALPAASIIVIRQDRATKGRPFGGAPWRQ